MRQIYTICFGQCGKYLNSFSLFAVTNLRKSLKLMRIRAIVTDLKQKKTGANWRPGKSLKVEEDTLKRGVLYITWPG